MALTEVQIHSVAVWTIIALAIVTFVYLFRFTAPYGRHYTGSGWGPHIDNRLGWVVMELPTTAVFALIYFAGEAAWNTVPLVLLVMWQGHYLHRLSSIRFGPAPGAAGSRSRSSAPASCSIRSMPT